MIKVEHPLEMKTIVMRKNWKKMLTAGFFGLLLTMPVACDKDDDLLLTEVPEVVSANFAAMFPGTWATWEKDRGLLKAEFWHKGHEVDVWYQADGTWVGTETDIPVYELPEPVTDYVVQKYPDRYIDDADWVQTPTGDYYLLELDKHNAKDIYIKLSPEGVLIP